MIILLVLFLFLLILMLYVIHKCDIMYPSIVLAVVFSICIIFSVYNWTIWSMDEFGFESAALIFSAVLLFAVCGVIIERILFGKKKYVTGRVENGPGCIREITVSAPLLIADIAVCAATLVWFLSQVRRITGGGSWVRMMAVYRQKASYGVLSAEESMPSILLQLTKLVTVQGYIFSYIIVNNIVARRLRMRDLPLMIPVAIMGATVISSAGRRELLQLAAGILMAFYVLWHRKNGWNRNLSGKYVRVGFFSLFGLLALFYLTKDMVGRSASQFDPMYYITLYVGGSIKLFDMFMKNPAAPSNIWGKETFHTLNQFLSKFGTVEPYIPHLEFRFAHGINVGNVYTALRRYIYDFGIGGMYLLVLLFSTFINTLYCRVKYSKKRYADFELLLLCYLFNSVPLFPINDVFYSVMFSVSYVINIALLYFMYLIFVKKKLRFCWKR